MNVFANVNKQLYEALVSFHAINFLHAIHNLQGHSLEIRQFLGTVTLVNASGLLTCTCK